MIEGAIRSHTGCLGFQYTLAEVLAMLDGQAAVLIRVMDVVGSSPRGVGAWMVVSRTEQFNSIGGGHLEHHAVERAREILRGELTGELVEIISLGAKLGQCCGGRVKIGFDKLTVNPAGIFSGMSVPAHSAETNPTWPPEAFDTPTVAIAGMGHVGTALVNFLAPFPLALFLGDTREGQELPLSKIGTSITIEDDLTNWIEKLPARAHLFIMTHRHDLDLHLVQLALMRRREWAESFGSIGLIGSHTKWRRFSERLRNKGFVDEELAFVQCPIGPAERSESKQPGVIALQIAHILIDRFSREYKSLFA